MGHAPAQRLGCAVDELDLIGPPDDLVGKRLALLNARDALDDVVHRLEVLDVDGRDDVDPGLQQFFDVLPTFLVARSGNVRMRELVDQRHVWSTGEDGVDVHLLELAAAVSDRLARNDLEVADLLDRAGPPVCLHEADDHVGAAVVAPSPLVEHRERLADARRGAEIDPKVAPGHAATSRGPERG